MLDEILRDNKVRLSTCAELIMNFLDFHTVEYTPPDAGVFIWARLGGADCTWKGESELSDRLEGAGVSLGPGQTYCALEPGWFRICFAVPRPVLYEALSRVEKGLGVEKEWKQEEAGMVSREDSEVIKLLATV
jgi:DNA-binding transcriptional MocR family regulator